MGHAGLTLGCQNQAGWLFVGMDPARLSDYLKRYILKRYSIIFSVYTKRLILLCQTVYTDSDSSICRCYPLQYILKPDSIIPD